MRTADVLENLKSLNSPDYSSKTAGCLLLMITAGRCAASIMEGNQLKAMREIVELGVMLEAMLPPLTGIKLADLQTLMKVSIEDIKE